jgi:scyllo-inosamine-4-phosphate amidinotransferase 1
MRDASWSVSVHNEWDPLQEVIVGTAVGAKLPAPDVSTGDPKRSTTWSHGVIPQSAIDETEEDLDELVAALRAQGVTVQRPEAPSGSPTIRTAQWEAERMFPYCPRDVLLAVGDTLIEAPCTQRARLLEADCYRPLLLEYSQRGARWISAPRPRLDDALYEGPDGWALTEREPVFDAANVLRIGRDVLYQVSCSGNERGGQWLQRTLGERYRVHVCRDLYAGMHIDTTIAPLAPGLVLVNPSRVDKRRLPDVFARWTVIEAPEPVGPEPVGLPSLASRWLSMNLLMVNPRLAIVDREQRPLIAALARHGVESIGLRLRHGRALAGGFHCVTLDVRRSGSLDDYR